jgi:hypothetical protein
MIGLYEKGIDSDAAAEDAAGAAAPGDQNSTSGTVQ